jgi:hypothetical protein
MADAFGPDFVWSPYVPERTVIKDAADTVTPLPDMKGVPAAGMAEVYAGLAARLIEEVKLS